MFATVLDSAKIELMGKHANKTVHSDVYFHHSTGYCLNILSFLQVFIIQSLRMKLSRKSTERTHHIHAERRVLQILKLCVLASKRYMYGLVPGRFGPESFRSWVVSAWVVSVLGRFGQIWWFLIFSMLPLGKVG